MRFTDHLPRSVQAQLIDSVAALLLPEYGAIFAAAGGAVAPDRLIFRNEVEVAEFQSRVEIGNVQFDGISIELQAAAATKLSDAVDSASRSGLSISPRGPDAGRRSYADTVSLWQSRVDPALEHWKATGDLKAEEADKIRTLQPSKQVAKVFELEKRGLWFSKDLSKSIIYSVAPPGASQHLSMLAFDVSEFNDPAVRCILADNYWYQTVVSDLPHFTFLGMSENELPMRALRKVSFAEREFWLPDVEDELSGK